jgi:hypothetical protein
LDQSIEAKIEWKLTWHCFICCNPSKRRVDFEDGWLIKSSFKTKDEIKACQLTRTELPQEKKKIVNPLFRFSNKTTPSIPYPKFAKNLKEPC